VTPPHPCSPGDPAADGSLRVGDVRTCPECDQRFTLIADEHRLPNDPLRLSWIMGVLQREKLDPRDHAHLLPVRRNPETGETHVETERDAYVP
jgi:hypothetical protein